MNDLISRQAAIDELREEVEFEYDEKDEQWYYIEADMAIGAIERLPSAQPEIIRCNDCKHLQRWRSEESVKKFGQAYECLRNVIDCPKPDDFCSYAERRTDG